MPLPHQIVQWIQHWLRKESSHSIHSPALYRFYQVVIHKEIPSRTFSAIEASRDLLLAEEKIVPFQNLGSGNPTTTGTVKTRKVAGKSLTPPKWCRLLARLSQEIQAKNILELGTSFGISTLYLSVNPESKVWTMEGNQSIAFRAQQIFESLQRSNIKLIVGNIDQKLPEVLESIPELDLVFLDANHRYAPTIRYAEAIVERLNSGGFMIVDDIHRSKEMDHAWRKLKANSVFEASIDLFRWGILIKGPSNLSGHHVWNFA